MFAYSRVCDAPHVVTIHQRVNEVWDCHQKVAIVVYKNERQEWIDHSFADLTFLDMHGKFLFLFEAVPKFESSFQGPCHQRGNPQIHFLLKNRTNPKKILEKIARSIPEDLWFDIMTINEKNEVIISGGSYSPRAIGEFITTINDSPYFGGSITPSKQESKKENLDGIPTNYERFELRGKITNYDMRSK